MKKLAFHFHIWYNCSSLASVLIYYLVNPAKKYSLFVLHCGSSGQHSSLNKSKLLCKRPWFMMKIFLLTWSQLCFRWVICVQHFLVIVNSKCSFSFTVYKFMLLFSCSLLLYITKCLSDLLCFINKRCLITCLRTACSILLLVKIMLVWEW